MTTARTEPRLPVDLAPLAPRRSPLRNLALAALGVLVLVGAWFSPAALRPALTGSSGGGWSVELLESSTVLTVSQLHPEAWPFATIDGVEAIPGATPTGAWVYREDENLGGGDPGETAPHQFLEASFPELTFPPEGNLPVRVSSAGDTSGGQLVIAIAWRIDDCTAFGETVDGITYSDQGDEAPRAIVSNVFGVESRTSLGVAAHPIDIHLGSSEICPG